MSEKTHYRELFNSDYIGAYSLEPGKDLVVTIKSVKKEAIVSTDGKKEDCVIAQLIGQKPMIVNATNAKTIRTVLGTPFIEEWAGGRIQLYSTPVKAFGDVMDALRVRKFAPKAEKTDEKITCDGCGEWIKPYGKMTAKGLADYTYKNYGHSFCSECAATAARNKKLEEAEKEQGDKQEETEQTEPTQTETEETVNE